MRECQLCHGSREIELSKPSFAYFWCGCRGHGRCPWCTPRLHRWAEAIYLFWRTLTGNPP